MPDSKPTIHQDTQSEEHAISPGEIIIGDLTGIDDVGRPLVNFSGHEEGQSLVAMTTQEVTRKHIGRQVALLFANGKSQQPVIVGLIHDPLADILENFSIPETQATQDTPFPEVSAAEEAQFTEIKRDEEDQVLVDGKRITIQGAEEITLKCGKASITLTKSGKILIRGTYLSNRSTGVNRIMGGSVQIN